MKLNTWTKLFLVSAAFIVAVICFMIKLPAGFKHIDKELHAAFYFLAAAFLNFLFANKKNRYPLVDICCPLFIWHINRVCAGIFQQNIACKNTWPF